MFQSELHYKNYLMEVERILKQDPHFRAKMKNSTIEDFMVRRARRLRSHPVLTCTLTLGIPALQAGRLTKELDFVHRNVRSKLDELKKEELNRLRSLLKAKHAIAEERGGVDVPGSGRGRVERAGWNPECSRTGRAASAQQRFQEHLTTPEHTPFTFTDVLACRTRRRPPGGAQTVCAPELHELGEV